MRMRRRKKLCPNCKVGQATYLRDARSPFCPYLCCHDGKACTQYEKLETAKKRRFFGLF